MSSPSPEEFLTLLLKVSDLKRDFDLLKIRHDAMEDFIKEQYPAHFAGEVGTIVDPDLNPIEFNVGEIIDDLRPDLSSKDGYVTPKYQRRGG